MGAVLLASGGVLGVAAVAVTVRWAIALLVYKQLAKDGNQWGAKGLAELVRALRPGWPSVPPQRSRRRCRCRHRRM